MSRRSKLRPSPSPNLSGFSHILYSDPRLLASLGGSSSVAVAASKREKRTALDTVEIQMRNVRSTIKSILSNPDSRKIYYFLCLNLAYMFIQMMYVKQSGQ